MIILIGSRCCFGLSIITFWLDKGINHSIFFFCSQVSQTCSILDRCFSPTIPIVQLLCKLENGRILMTKERLDQVKASARLEVEVNGFVGIELIWILSVQTQQSGIAFQ